MAGQRIYYGSERQRHEGSSGRAALLNQLDEPGFAADNEAAGRAFWSAATGLGLDARFVDDAMARADDNLASRTQDSVAVASSLAVWLEDDGEAGLMR
jgi:hypothetical protein